MIKNSRKMKMNAINLKIDNNKSIKMNPNIKSRKKTLS